MSSAVVESESNGARESFQALNSLRAALARSPSVGPLGFITVVDDFLTTATGDSFLDAGADTEVFLGSALMASTIESDLDPCLNAPPLTACADASLDKDESPNSEGSNAPVIIGNALPANLAALPIDLPTSIPDLPALTATSDDGRLIMLLPLSVPTFAVLGLTG